MGECIFCQIANNESKESLLYVDDDFAIFEDKYPSAPIHYLIVPKKHVVNLIDFDKVEAGKMIALAKEFAREKKINNYRIQINNGKKAGQVVFHLHMHLQGWKD